MLSLNQKGGEGKEKYKYSVNGDFLFWYTTVVAIFTEQLFYSHGFQKTNQVVVFLELKFRQNYFSGSSKNKNKKRRKLLRKHIFA